MAEKQTRLNDKTNDQLIEITKKRKADNHLVATKQGVIAELVDKAYKREVGK